MSAAFTARSTTKAKSRSTGWNGDSSSAGFALGRRRRPVAAAAGRLGARAAHAARGRKLVLRAVAAEDLPDLEQRHVAEAAIGILLRRGGESRNEARPHVGEVGRNGIGERQLPPAAAEH